MEVLKSNLYDFNDTLILGRYKIIILGRNAATKVAFINCEPLTKSTIKLDGTPIADAEDLYLVIP